MTNDSRYLQEDMENILTNVAQTENFISYEVFFNKNQIKGSGFRWQFFVGEILNNDNGETTQVVIKRAPVSGFTLNLDNQLLYKNEVFFYSTVFPRLDKLQKDKKAKCMFNNIPRFLTASLDSENMYITMEDLRSAGYVFFDKGKYLSSGHLNLIFKSYGRFHALSFTYKQKYPEEYGNLKKNFAPVMQKWTDSCELRMQTGKAYRRIIELFDPIGDAEVITKLKNVDVRKVMKDVHSYKGDYECFVHGNCWSKYMLFKNQEFGEPEDVKLMDFQLFHSSTPIHDLSYSFYTGASKEDMDKLDHYLNLYYQRFSCLVRELDGNPEEVFPFDIFKKEWKYYGLWGIFLGIQLWGSKLLDKDETASISNQEREDCIERARNICLHAVEYGIL